MKKILFKNFLAFTLFVSICSSLLFSYTVDAKENSTDTQILATYDMEEVQLINVNSEMKKF